MKKTFRRTLACLLAVLMVAFSMPFSAFATQINRCWWEDDGLKISEVKEEPEYFGYNSDETYQELGSWCLPFGNAIEIGPNDELGYEDHRDDYKPVIGVTVSNIGKNSDTVANKKTAATAYYGATTSNTYDKVKAAGNILDPNKLEAGQRIAVTLEIGGFDAIITGQFKGTYNTDYLTAASYPSPPSRSDTWKQYKDSTAAAWVKTGADMGYGSALAFNGANTNDGTFYIAITGGAAANGMATTSNFIGTGLNDPDGARPFGKYGIVAGVVCFEVLQDCNLADVFAFNPCQFGVDDGTVFSPYAVETLGGTAQNDETQWRISVNSTSNDVFANAAVIWSETTAYDNVEPTPTVHTHNTAEATPVANNDGTHTATCTADGCDESEGYQITSDCTMEVVSTTAATCGKDGLKTLACTVCGYETTEKIPATENHTWNDGEVTKAATCVATGVKTFTCTVCGETKTEEIAATGVHTWDEGTQTQAPTCTVDGVKTFTCTVCKATKTEAIDATGHTEETIPAVAPTCTEKGATAGVKCSVCGAIITAPTEIPAKGHTEVEIPAVAPTCTEDGTTAGVKCSVCGEVLTAPQVDPAKGHTEVEIPAVAPTCTEDGTTAGVKCSVCGEVLTAPQVDPAKGHTEVEIPAVAPTCVTDGTTAGVKCSVCGEVLTAPQVDPATGVHTWGEGVVTTAPTMKDAGVMTYTCTVCNEATKTEAIAAIGVNVTVDAADLGTVTVNGTDVSEGATVNVPFDSDVTLVAEPVDGATFIGWTANGATLVSKDATFVTKALADVTYTPVFAIDGETFTVVFTDVFGNVISTQSVKAADEIKVPTAPTFVGYNFTGWSMTDEEIAALAAETVITAQYELAETTFTITATDACTISANGESATGVLADVAMDAVVTVTAEGATAWTIDGVTVAYGDTYTFFAAADVTVVPTFAANVTATPTVAAVSMDRIAGSHKVTFVATRSMTDDCTYVSAGFVYGKDLAEKDLTLDMVGKKGSNATSGAVKAIYCATDAEQFSLNYGVSAATGTASARAFLAYVDANGDTQVVYAAPQVYAY